MAEVKALVERTTWPLWEYLSNEALVALIKFQWENYGLKLDLMTDAFREIESLDEIQRIMVQRPRYMKEARLRG